jgi:hypothetical protein
MTVTEATADVPDVREKDVLETEACCRFRLLNDQICDIERFQEGEHAFVCECSDEACTRALRMELTEYVALRADIQTFAVLPGHDEGLEVLTRSDRYLVIRNGAARSPVPATHTPRATEAGTTPAGRTRRLQYAVRRLVLHLAGALESGGRVGWKHLRRLPGLDRR